MDEILTNVSWTGVVVGGIAAFVLGWLWYSPILFGKKWAEAHGVEMSSAAKMPIKAMVAQILGLMLVSWFVGVTAVTNSLLTAILALAGFGLLYDAGAMFANTPTPGRVINLTYWIAAFAVMVVAQGIF